MMILTVDCLPIQYHQQSQKRQPRGCDSVYKSINLIEDLEELGISMKQPRRKRGTAKTARRGISRGAGSPKVLPKKQKIGK